SPVPTRPVRGSQCLCPSEWLLLACRWTLRRLSCYARALQNADVCASAVGADALEPGIASLIVPPDEALQPIARCPRPRCRVTDDLLCRAYVSGTRMVRLGNSLSHLVLGVSSSLESVLLDQSTQSMVDVSLQAFALMMRMLGRTLSMLCYAQSPGAHGSGLPNAATAGRTSRL
ncbi:hypothetical protein GOODEAATRI_033052, partial [Goodea atripinnis]